MKWREPAWIKNFQCIASACTDTCCAGWEVEVDEDAAKRYQNVSGPFGERLRRELRCTEEENYFALTEDNRCPFLNTENLCELYMNLGEDALCDICTEHPRFYNWFGDYTEKGLGLCCEEAERLLFAQTDPMKFVVEEDTADMEGMNREAAGEADTAAGEEKDPDIAEDPWLPQLLSIREHAFALLQDRTQPVSERLWLCRTFLVGIQRILDAGQWPYEASVDTLEETLLPNLIQWAKIQCTGQENDVPEAVQAYTAGTVGDSTVRVSLMQVQAVFDYLTTLECLNPAWMTRVNAIRGKLPELWERGFSAISEKQERMYEWEHLAVYFVYRYLMEALYDEDIQTRIDFMMISMIVLGMLAAYAELTELEGYTEISRDEWVRMYSREIEYCPENMEAIYDALRNGELFAIEE